MYINLSDVINFSNLRDIDFYCLTDYFCVYMYSNQFDNNKLINSNF